MVSDYALDEERVTILLIGCGDYQLIEKYAGEFKHPSRRVLPPKHSHGEAITKFHRPIYADPSRALFKHFGMISNLKTTPMGEPKKSYVSSLHAVANVVQSIWVIP